MSYRGIKQLVFRVLQILQELQTAVGVLKVAEYLFGFVYSIETLPYKLSA
jgi:hypothetical protein